MRTNWIFIGLVITLGLLASCEDFLDERPDFSLAVPNSLQDLQALINEEGIMNVNYPDAGDIASDYFYLLDNDWAARDEEVRKTYVWDSRAEREQWRSNYARVDYTNIILENVDGAELGYLNESDRRRIKGSALFFRGYTFLHLANVYAPPYEAGGNNGRLGIPLRLESDVEMATVRSTILETYNQILSDLKSAAKLLPMTSETPIAPSKPAAFAALARVYLIMGDYVQAANYADSCLALRNGLLNYAHLEDGANIPFDVFHIESLLYATLSGSSGVFNQSRAKVVPEIYSLYDEHDLRLNLFFVQNGDGSHAFKGSYAGRAPTRPFCGLATDEVYLIAAECQARMGNVESCLNLLNTLLEKRYDPSAFIPVNERDADALLRMVLQERLKELVFRGGIYWSDLRRLNLDARFARTLERSIEGAIYRLEPNDKRYTFLIPTEVIQFSGIPQNAR